MLHVFERCVRYFSSLGHACLHHPHFHCWTTAQWYWQARAVSDIASSSACHLLFAKTDPFANPFPLPIPPPPPHPTWLPTRMHECIDVPPGHWVQPSCARALCAGSVNLDDDFWCDSPHDHVLHRLHIRKQNPFGPVSSPRASTGTHTITMDSVGSGLDSMSSGVDSHVDNGDVGMHESWSKVRHTAQMRS